MRVGAGMRAVARVLLYTGTGLGIAVCCGPGASAASSPSPVSSTSGTPTATATPTVTPTPSAPEVCEPGDLHMTDETSNGGVTTVYSTGSLAVDTVVLRDSGSADCPYAGFMVQVYPVPPAGDAHRPTLDWRVDGGSWQPVALTWMAYSSGDPGWQTGMMSYGVAAHSSETIELGLSFPSGTPNETLDTGVVSYAAQADSGYADFGTQIAWSLYETPQSSGSPSADGGGGGGDGTRASANGASASSASPADSSVSKSPSSSATPDDAASPSPTVSAATAPSTSVNVAKPTGSPGLITLSDTHGTASDRASLSAAFVALVACVGFGTVPLMRRRRPTTRSRRD